MSDVTWHLVGEVWHAVSADGGIYGTVKHHEGVWSATPFLMDEPNLYISESAAKKAAERALEVQGHAVVTRRRCTSAAD